MSADNGRRPAYIAIARKAFTSDPFWLEHRVFSKWEAWQDLLQIAAWQEREWAAGGAVVRLARSETIPLSRVYLADRWGWGEKQVYGYIQQLRHMDRIQPGQRTAQGTTYRIVNYDLYQGGGTGEGTELSQRDGQADAQDRGQGKGQAKGQRRGQKDKHEAGKQESSTNLLPRETWLTPYWNAWREHGGEIPAGRLSKAIKSVHDAVGGPKRLAYGLTKWLIAGNAKYGPETFARDWRTWVPDPSGAARRPTVEDLDLAEFAAHVDQERASHATE
jgi:hypothetical protein